MKTPGWLIKVRRNSSIRLLGRWIERKSKLLVHGIFRLFIRPPAPVDPLKLENVQQVLLLRPNFRIGNTLISTPLIPAIRRKFPSARLDYLGADTTAILLENLPIDNVFRMSRSFILRPWAYLRLLHQLNKQKYDLVIKIGKGSFSEMLCMYFLNARYRMGTGKWADGVCNIRVESAEAWHAYDGPVVLARALGISCLDKPVYIPSEQEKNKAVSRLLSTGFANGQKIAPFVVFFVGGHKEKRWPAEYWENLVVKLKSIRQMARILILLGPEELSFGARIRALPEFSSIPVFDPLPLRDFAAIIQEAQLIVTPDTGPMHLAVALNVPTIAVLQNKVSLTYAPRGEQDVSLLRPTLEKVLESIQAHKNWPGISAECS